MHLDARLAPGQGYGFIGSLMFRTVVEEQRSGAESRLAAWAQGRHRYTAQFRGIGVSEYGQIKAVFSACRGRAHAFRFFDWLDGYLRNEVFAQGDGITTEFQISKGEVAGGVEYRRLIYALWDNVVVTVDGAPASPAIDRRTGLVTFDEPPPLGAVLRATGKFDVWVRFENDELPFSLDGRDITQGSVDLIEVMPPKPGQP